MRDTTMPPTMSHNESDFSTDGRLLAADAQWRDLQIIYVSETGWARLFRARRWGKWHVLKTLKAEWQDRTLGMALLRKEFEVTYGVDHPNIVSVTALEIVDGLGPCLVMEFIDGKTLRQLMNDHTVDAEMLEKCMLQLVDVLHYLQQRGVVHRDLKPENILLTHTDHRLKLIDFGCADTPGHAILKRGSGTLNYRAPEQDTGADCTHRTDLFALGRIVAETAHLLPWPRRRHWQKLANELTCENPLQRPDDYAAITRCLGIRPHYTLFWMSLAALIVLGAVLATNRFTQSGPPDTASLAKQAKQKPHTVPLPESNAQAISALPEPVQKPAREPSLKQTHAAVSHPQRTTDSSKDRQLRSKIDSLPETPFIKAVLVGQIDRVKSFRESLTDAGTPPSPERLRAFIAECRLCVADYVSSRLLSYDKATIEALTEEALKRFDREVQQP